MTHHAETKAALAVRGRPLTARETQLIDAVLDDFFVHEAKQERRRARDAIAPNAVRDDLDRLAAEYQRSGHRPVIDHVLELILIDCPYCGAQADDSLGMWRPARVIPRGKHLFILCTSCGRHRGGRLR